MLDRFLFLLTRIFALLNWFLFFLIADHGFENRDYLMGPFELTPAYSGMVESYYTLFVNHLLSNFGYLLIPRREVSKNGAPDSAVEADSQSLSSRCVHLLGSVFFHTILQC